MFATTEIFGVSVTWDALFWMVFWPGVIIGGFILTWLSERKR